ncbi:MAG: SUMF1/EgtB/PvdO family nonheme iron enzyme [Paludibacteraceae bacterium]|nr:SUMF1/EgtB/PvdO family nonheme iron enzyme [Paludibacteraceae bacterium]
MKEYHTPTMSIQLCVPFKGILTSSNSRTFTETERKKIIDKIRNSMVEISGGRMKIGDRHSDFYAIISDPINTTKVLIYDFKLCNHPVTEEEWACIMGLQYTTSQVPVSNITWREAQAFNSRLNILTGGKYRLPTEAEWEFAARGGVLDEDYYFSGSNTLDRVGWYSDNTNKKRPVMLKNPNQLGLYDMSGNVWEWCFDWYGSEYQQGEWHFIGGNDDLHDPKGAPKGSKKVYRGGSYANGKEKCQVFMRDYSAPDYCSDRIGFRIAESIFVDE